MRLIPRLFVVTAFMMLASCAPRPGFIALPEGNAATYVQSVLVGTNRGLGEDGRYTASRGEGLNFHSFDISIPKDRKLGEIKFPTGTPNFEKHFLTVGHEDLGASGGFERKLRTSLKALPRKDRETIVFVHGFNTSLAEGVYRSAQLMHDFELDGVGVHYAWPSASTPFGYGYDRDSVLFARDGFEEFLRSIQRAGSERVLVIAHSMGALLTMETLRQSPELKHELDGVLLMSPDIDVDVFRAQASKIGTLPQPFLIFVSQKDRALKLSARLTGQKDRLGTLNDPTELSDLKVTILDVTAFSDGGFNHFVTGDSSALIRLFSKIDDLDTAFAQDRSSRPGLLPGTALRVQNATQIILQPTRR